MSQKKVITKTMEYQEERFLYIRTRNKIIAVQGKNRGVARCHPEDEKRGLYDERLGLDIAVARLKMKKTRKQWIDSVKKIRKTKQEYAKYLREIVKASQEYIKRIKIENERAIKTNAKHTETMNLIADLMQEVDRKCRIQAKKTNNILL